VSNLCTKISALPSVSMEVTHNIGIHFLFIYVEVSDRALNIVIKIKLFLDNFVMRLVSRISRLVLCSETTANLFKLNSTLQKNFHNAKMLEKIVNVIIENACVRMKVDTCSHTRKVLKYSRAALLKRYGCMKFIKGWSLQPPHLRATKPLCSLMIILDVIKNDPL